MTRLLYGDLARPPKALAGIAVGDSVIYASHGLGCVTQRDRAPDGSGERVIIEFEGGLSVTLPVERALAYLRAPCGPGELATVERTLRAAPSASDEVWRTRLKANTTKVAVGAAVGLAEVIRDCAKRPPKLDSRGNDRALSLAERDLYRRARQLLVEEIAAARGVAAADADHWIAAQLGEPEKATF